MERLLPLLPFIGVPVARVPYAVNQPQIAGRSTALRRQLQSLYAPISARFPISLTESDFQFD